MVVRTSLFVGFFVGFLLGCQSADSVRHAAFTHALKSCNAAFFNTNIVYYHGYRIRDYCSAYAGLAANGKPLPPLP